MHINNDGGSVTHMCVRPFKSRILSILNYRFGVQNMLNLDRNILEDLVELIVCHVVSITNLKGGFVGINDIKRMHVG